MSGEITHFLDGIQVSEPKGWEDFAEELSRDGEKRIITVKYDTSLTFTHDGYEYLDNVFKATGHCGLVTYEARQDCGDVQYVCARGVVIVADVRFNIQRCEAEGRIVDDGVGARIINNLGIPISPQANKSKNSVDITPVPLISVRLFLPSDPEPDYLDGRSGWDWYDAIRHAAQYVTDGGITVVSDWYQALPDNERYFITNGYSVRNPALTLVRTSWSFGDLFYELGKKYNLWMSVERLADGSPRLRIEPESYFYSSNVWASQNVIPELIRTCDTQRLWAKVSVGGSKSIKETETTLSLPYIPLRAFVEEEFHLKGVCNTDATLDLVNQWVIDTNVIEDILVNATKDYDEDLFLIQYDINTGYATKGDYLNPGNNPYLYNEALQNGKVIERYALPSEVGAWIDPDDASFKAFRVYADNTPVVYDDPIGGTTTPFQVQFDVDFDLVAGNVVAPGFDTTNNWGNGTPQGNFVSQANSRYTAIGVGYYEFDVYLRWQILSNLSITNILTPFSDNVRASLEFTLNRYDSGNNLVSAQTFNTPYVFQPGLYDVTQNIGTSMNIGDYVEVEAFWRLTDAENLVPDNPPAPPGGWPAGINLRMRPFSFIASNFIASGGYVSSGGAGRVVTYEYERAVDLASWVSLTGDPRQRIMIGAGPTAGTITHFLRARRNVKTGFTEWNVIQDP